MSLSKQQLFGAVGAGVFVLCAGALGFMLYSAWDERGETEEQLESEMARFQGYNNADVFPSKAAIASVRTNGVGYAAWFDSAIALAARGDRTFPDESPPIFKQRLQAEVRRMAALEGGVEGKIAAPSFLFGFEQYLGEGGTLPKEADVPRLVVQLDTISRVVDLLAEAGILELKAIQRIEEKTADEDDAPARGKKNAKKAAAEADDGPKETCLQYAFEFTTRPAALVTALNRLAASARFMTVRNLAFRQTADVIVERLGAIEAAQTQKTTGVSTSRRGRRAAAAAAQVDAKTGAVKIDPLVIDPELDAPIQVNFTLEVRDFGRPPAAPAVEAAEESTSTAPQKPAAADKKEETK